MKSKIYTKICSIKGGASVLLLLQNLKSYFGSEAIIQGSYLTSNIGDMALAYIIKDELRKMGIKAHINGFLTSRFFKFKPNFSKYKLHILGGGGSLRDDNPKYLKNQLFGIGIPNKTIAIGMGVPGIRTKEGRSIIKKLDKCSFITVRDITSKNNLQPFLSKEVIVTACPVFLLKRGISKIKLKRENKRVIGINLKDISEKGEYLFYPKIFDIKRFKQRYHKFITGIFRRQLLDLSKEADLVFIPFTKEDIKFAKKMLPKNIRILPLQSPPETLDTINRVDNMICMRYHSLVYSILAEKPTFVISYADKVRDLVKKIENINYMDLSDFKHKEIKFNQSKDMIKIKNKMIKKAKKNFEMIRNELS